MTSDRKKPGVAFWATVVVVVILVGYPLSIGPACWVTSRSDAGGDAVSLVYQPIFRFWWRGKMPEERDPLRSYLRLLAGDGWDIAQREDESSEYYWSQFWIAL